MTVIPWTLTIVGIAASLIWNLFNYRRTISIQTDVRQQQVRLEEFRRLRGLIDTSVAAIIEVKKQFEGLLSSHTLAAIVKAADAPQKALPRAYLDLCDTLDIVNDSAFAEGKDWVDTTAPAWEACNEQLYNFGEATDLAIAKQHVEGAVQQLTVLVRVLHQRLEREVGRFSPAKVRKQHWWNRRQATNA